jgi:hypothetical protein
MPQHFGEELTMKFATLTAIALLSTGICSAVNATSYVVLPDVIAEGGGTMFFAMTSGTQIGAPSTQFDSWGLTMDRNLACCYDENRQLPEGLTPGNTSEFTSGPLSLLTFTGYVPGTYTGYACGYSTTHSNISSLWVHVIDAEPTQWTSAAYAVVYAIESWW